MSDQNDIIALTTEQPIDEVVVESADGGWMSMVPIILIVTVMYFLLIRPQEQKRKEHESLVNTLKKGDEVLLNSGIFGVVKSINDSDATIILEIADKIEVKALKSSVADVLESKKSAAKAKKKSK